MSDLDGTTLGARLRQLRGKESRDEFAPKIGIYKTLLGKYERDESVPGAEVLLRYRQLTGVDINWLLEGREEGPDEELGLLIAAAISSAYETSGKSLPAGLLGKMTVSIYHRAMAFSDEAARHAFVTGETVKILKELRSDSGDKRTA